MCHIFLSKEEFIRNLSLLRSPNVPSSKNNRTKYLTSSKTLNESLNGMAFFKAGLCQHRKHRQPKLSSGVSTNSIHHHSTPPFPLFKSEPVWYSSPAPPAPSPSPALWCSASSYSCCLKAFPVQFTRWGRAEFKTPELRASSSSSSSRPHQLRGGCIASATRSSILSPCWWCLRSSCDMMDSCLTDWCVDTSLMKTGLVLVITL